MGSCNYVCVLGRYSNTRCSAGRITTAINPRRRLWDAETWTLDTWLFYLFAFEKFTIEKEFFFSLLHFLGAQIVFCLRKPTFHRAGWQHRQSATADEDSPVLILAIAMVHF
ncbi:hypothetical protein AVEN_123769-1 [Araneus ventricosus]|uniref:Uncharacterized protein n=1 Tax=Araneus ventricosus TaxID=182803 RepID=A0A4Y2BK44_ARAVE|nr:hypothetical protein AVEN_123769-1 [Araneus ventricosus]